ncbi:MAG: phosphodiester glycosidase family protein [Anaerolineae bacterium]|nr:MAG: phosphodiester glycosidase family protein [Anaerolineae bacterium]
MRKRILAGCGGLLLVCGCLWIGILAWPYVRPQPAPIASERLFEGVTYTRRVTRSPRPLVIHIVQVDLKAEGIRLLVTPGDPKADLPLTARTTSQFVREFGVQIAINGDGFTPWGGRGFWDTYPRPGDRIAPIGFAASQGVVYSQDTDSEPTVYFGPNNQVGFEQPVGRVTNALSGNAVLVRQGKALPQADEAPAPRTALGVSGNGRYLYLVVVDGRQAGYSEGMTLDELAALFVELGAQNAINLDGGGSSTLVRAGRLGPVVMNSPIHRGRPGWERPVGNHLGVFARP